ncbi:Os04g0508050 [Oryza sativa Japonica Group]|uniref:Os04g0508050 protein n=1 Tax=Oryza sativa subsp. japonica TaxID=39947 RepID=A0A0P0WCH3_ORYSJ|nr:hypothetical protein EE612_024309 [Oryza sativa]BAS90005.1 Os04g0508050 [Oryza sativa Japonica Group]
MSAVRYAGVVSSSSSNLNLASTTAPPLYPLVLNWFLPDASYILLLSLTPCRRMHTRDSHMLRFSESPTNMILCPLSLSRKSIGSSNVTQRNVRKTWSLTCGSH